MKKNVVLGVTGGIAAYKALDIVSRLKKMEIDVHVIMTESAAKFVAPLSFQSLSQNQVIVDMFAEPKSFEIQHISLAQKADLFVVAPASANIIGKIASGIADDMLSTTIMATKAQVLFAPAMNTNMYNNPILQKNIELLKSFGYKFIEPEEGRLACGDYGAGKLADTEKIVDLIDMMLYENKDYTGKKIIVTAGPTREDIDPVRYITNRSSGKMGYAIASAARNRGADVILISGPASIKAPVGVTLKKVYSADDMYDTIMEYYDESDVVIKAAAVADYKPEKKSSIKIKKTEKDMCINLLKNKDILMELGKQKSHQILVGFAAETNDVIENAKIKINKKNLDYIVVNDVTKENSGFDVDTNTVTVISKDGEVMSFPNMSKSAVAHRILDIIKENKR